MALVISSSANAKGSPTVFHTEAEHAKFKQTTPPRRPAIIPRKASSHHQKRTHK
jgi:hypothetical protein